MIAAYVEDTDRLGLGRPDAEPLATETIAEIVELIEALIDGRARLRVRRRRLLPRPQLRRLRQALQPRSGRDGPGRGGGLGGAQGEPARLRPVEGAKAGRGHRSGPRPGATGARAGTSSARRWPRSCSAPTSRSTAAAPTWSSPTTRTRSRRPRRRAACRWRGSGCTTGWSAPTTRRCRSRSATSSSSPRRSTASAPSGRGRLPQLRPLPPAARVLRGRARAGRRAGRADPQLPRASRAGRRGARTRSWPSAGRRSSPRSPTTSTPRAPGPRCSSWSPRATAGRCPAPARRSPSCCRCSASSRCSRPTTGADAEAEALLAEREAARADARLRPRRRAPRPARRARLGGPRHGRGRQARAARADRRATPEIVYGRRPVAEAKRGRRRVRRIWTAEDTDGRRAHPARGLARAPGDRRRGRSLPVRRPGGAARAPRGADRRPRPGPGPAQPRRRRPLGRGGGRRWPGDPRPALGLGDRGGRARPRPARSSTCRSPGSRNLAEWLARAKDAGAWVYGAEAEAPRRPTRRPTSPARSCSCSAARARACAALVAERCDALISIPVRGRVASLNVSAAAAALLFEAVRQRGRV